MKQQEFEQHYQHQWQAFEALLNCLDSSKKSIDTDGDLAAPQYEEFSSLYRKLCHYSALAKERRYSSALINRLNHLVLRGHQQLYRRKTGLRSQFLSFFVVGFPRLVRQEAKLFWLATALFCVPMLIMGYVAVKKPDVLYSMFSPGQIRQYEQMYDPANTRIGRDERNTEDDLVMFGHYVRNNISVSFRTFAGGLLLGIGSIFFLVFNGLFGGAVAGHLIKVGYAKETFFPFVIGHGAFELTAIVLAGAAGLKLGLAVLSPGRLSRLQALKQAAATSIQIMYGVIVMLVIAAFIEAYWSSSSVVSKDIKYLVGTFLWFFVAIYFLLSGRQRES